MSRSNLSSPLSCAIEKPRVLQSTCIRTGGGAVDPARPCFWGVSIIISGLLRLIYCYCCIIVLIMYLYSANIELFTVNLIK